MAFFETDGLGNSLLQTGTNILTSVINNKLAEKREKAAREDNYLYGEAAADAADKRTRELYSDLYSPQAQMQQIKEAGLSPSIYASGGIAGKSGVGGAMGTGATGVNPTTFGANPVDLSQVQLNSAMANKANAEARNLKANEEHIKLQNEWQEYLNDEKRTEYLLLNSHITYDNGEEVSLYSLASDSNDYKDFINNVSKIHWGNDTQQRMHTERGQQILRDIFQAHNKFSTDIATLGHQEISAVFESGVLAALMQNNFAELSAQEQVAILRQNTENAELTSQQSEAWNNMLNKLGDGSGKDTAIIIGMLLNTLLGRVSVTRSITSKK